MTNFVPVKQITAAPRKILIVDGGIRVGPMEYILVEYAHVVILNLLVKRSNLMKKI